MYLSPLRWGLFIAGHIDAAMMTERRIQDLGVMAEELIFMFPIHYDRYETVIAISGIPRMVCNR
jgi:hypothetical protein